MKSFRNDKPEAETKPDPAVNRMDVGAARNMAGADGARSDRELDPRDSQTDRELSDAERIELFQQGMFNDALPNLPKIPGHHTCWLTTTNPRDTIQSRMRLGYTPVKPSDVPYMNGVDQLTVKGGTWDGFISCNEMLAFKIPEHLYRKYLEEAHHHAPAREDEGIVKGYERLAEEARSVGSRMDMGDGLSSMKETASQRPMFE